MEKSEINKDGESTITGDMIDKISEYILLKRSLKTLREDLKDLKQSDTELYDLIVELEDLMRKAKEIKEKIKSDLRVIEFEDKMKGTKERLDLIKEMIRIEMIENGESEREKGSYLLKLLYTLKESKSKNKNTIHKDQTSF